LLVLPTYLSSHRRRSLSLSLTPLRVYCRQKYSCRVKSCDPELEYTKKLLAMHCHDFHGRKRLRGFKRQEALVSRIKDIYKRKLAEELAKTRKQAPTPKPKPKRKRRARLTMPPSRSKTPKREAGDPERFRCYIGNCLNEPDNNYQCELDLVEHFVKMHRCRAWAM